MNNNNIWITVPTYWGDYGTPDNPPCIDFDHPTSPNGEGTLYRTIESLCQLPEDFSLLVVLAVTHKEYLDKSRARVLDILSSFRNKKIYLVTPEDVEQINSFLNLSMLRMDSYGSIRNVQLFIPYCLGAEYIVGIDDDEIIEDNQYLKKVITGLQGKQGAGGLAGPYFDSQGEYRIRGAEALGCLENLFLKKNYFMNEALKKAMEQYPHIHTNVVAFGGNMVFPRETVEKVCHDPYIPRGEDYDYVINALMKNIRFCFHPDAAIIHLPPDSEGSQAGDNIRKLKADIRRFIYMSIKLNEHRRCFPDESFHIELLKPYPGAFAIDPEILIQHGKKALQDAYPGSMTLHEIDCFVRKAAEDAITKSAEFFEYSKFWNDMIPFCAENRALQSKLKHLSV